VPEPPGGSRSPDREDVRSLVRSSSPLGDSAERILTGFVSELVEARAFLANILESSTEYSIIAMDLERRILSWNAGARRNYGYEPGEVLGRSSNMLHDPKEVESGLVEEMHHRALQEGRAIGIFTRIRKDGSRFLASVVITPRLGPEGKPAGYLLVSRDVTSEERRRREMAETRDFLDSILASSTEYAIVAKSLDRIVESWNEGAHRVYGYTAEEAQGLPCEALEAPADEAAWSAMYQQALATNKAEARRMGRRKDGTEFPLHAVVTLRRGADGKPEGYLLVAQDVSAQEQAEHDVAAARQHEVERLKALTRFQGDFINMAAHELATPLTPLRIQVELLKMQPGLDPKAKRIVDILERSERRLEGLVQDLLNAARIQSGRLSFEPKRLDLNAIVRAAVEDLQGLAEANGVRLELDLAPEAMALGDPRRLEQVVHNIVHNALKFTRKGGAVHVATRVDGHAHLVVQDEGIGIDPKDLERLSQPFVQVHNLGAAVPGTGLGLYIVRSIVEMHGGTLRIQSDGLGQGTTVEVAIPTRAPHPRPRRLAGDGRASGIRSLLAGTADEAHETREAPRETPRGMPGNPRDDPSRTPTV